MDLKSAVDALGNSGFFIWDEFLSHSEVLAVAKDFDELHHKSKFQISGLGKSSGPRAIDVSIRSDESYWLGPDELSHPQAVFWNRLEQIKSAANESLYLGLVHMEGHYSRYPESGYYQKHLDRFHSDDRRTLSMVLYLNTDWKKGDGGELRLFLPEETPSVREIAPIGGRLVCFLSGTIPHEVLETKKVRKSFAAWCMRSPFEG